MQNPKSHSLKCKELKIKTERRERGWDLGQRCIYKPGSGWSTNRPEGFPVGYFRHLISSPDTMTLLIFDHENLLIFLSLKFLVRCI